MRPEIFIAEQTLAEMVTEQTGELIEKDRNSIKQAFTQACLQLQELHIPYPDFRFIMGIAYRDLQNQELQLPEYSDWFERVKEKLLAS